MNYESLTATTLWLADNNNVINGTKEERAEVFRNYLDLLDIQFEYNPIPRTFAMEMLDHSLNNLLLLSPIEKKCVSWNAGRQTYARYPEQVLEAAEIETTQQQLIANPSPQKDQNKNLKGKT
jgi:hypothetical protein